MINSFFANNDHLSKSTDSVRSHSHYSLERSTHHHDAKTLPNNSFENTPCNLGKSWSLYILPQKNNDRLHQQQQSLCALWRCGGWGWVGWALWLSSWWYQWCACCCCCGFACCRSYSNDSCCRWCCLSMLFHVVIISRYCYFTLLLLMGRNWLG